MNSPIRSATRTITLAALSLLLLTAGMCRQVDESPPDPVPEEAMPALEIAEEGSERTGEGPTPAEIEEQERRAALEAAERELAEREARLAAEQERLRQERELQAERQRLAAEQAAAAERDRQLAEREEELRQREAELVERWEEPVAAPTTDQPTAPEPLPEPTGSYDGDFDEPWRESQESAVIDRESLPTEPGAEAPRADTFQATVQAGSHLEVQTIHGLTSATARVGDGVSSRLVNDLRGADGEIVIPAGAEVLGRVTEAVPYHRGGGPASLGVEFTEIIVSPEQRVGIRASFVELGADRRQNRKKVIAGAVVGAILGHVLGGDGSKNVIVGAAAGAAAGGAMVARSKDRDAEIPAGQVITLQLQEVVTVEIEYGAVAGD